MDFDQARETLVRRLAREIGDPRVLAAMARVPREEFVAAERVELAYVDEALAIGEGQTISQPTMVALMLEALELDGRERVLEIGAGSGYQAALLGELAREVVSTERIPALADLARARLARLGYRNVEVVTSRSGLGWPVGAPYDAIVVAAAAPAVPQSLLDQLALGGRLVLPVGTRDHQQLLRVRLSGDRIVREELGPCRFVPLIGDEAWEG